MKKKSPDSRRQWEETGKRVEGVEKSKGGRCGIRRPDGTLFDPFDPSNPAGIFNPSSQISQFLALVGVEWRRPGSNRQPPRCKRGALPIELRPQEQFQWAHLDSNQGPQPYQGCALTN